MIRATFLRDGDRLVGFECRGHSGYAESGHDIVCAGVSAVLITAANAMQELAGVPLDTRQDEDTGYLSAFPKDTPAAEKANRCHLFLAAARLGLETIATQYPDNVRVITKDRR